MAFDGITIHALREELSRELTGLHISKIAQPEADELLLTLKGNSKTLRLLLSANPSLPLVYLTEENKKSPLTAPNFCMLLRKHINGGRIVSITQPSLERVLEFTIEHLNEMGDLCRKTLIAEMMGKHSNLIFCDEKGMIIDSIKHISSQISSVREVLPGRDYFLPGAEEKKNPLEADPAEFLSAVQEKPFELAKAIYSSFVGISPLMASEIAFRAGADPGRPASALTKEQGLSLSHSFCALMKEVKEGCFEPVIYEKDGAPEEFSPIPLASFGNLTERRCKSISEMLLSFYDERAAFSRIRQKSSDLRHIVTTAYERSVKKYDLQSRQMKDTEKREKYQRWGELLTAYAYQIPEGAAVYEAEDYYTGETVSIPLDASLSPQENAQKYYARYQKLKRTYEALSVQLRETEAEKEHLESILLSLSLAENEEDLSPIRRELVETGYIRKKGTDKKVREKSRPHHFLSSDGFDLYVGKNNYQNDELTFKLANSGDWWFHAKKMPGSHVILRTGGKEVPDRAFEEAASLAAYYSRGKDGDKVEVDYLRRKDVKKTPGAAPGYVIYYTNYSMTVTPGIDGLTPVSE